MRILPALAAFCLTATMAAANSWSDFVQRRRNADPRVARWTLCLRPGDLPQVEAYKDPVFQRLLSSGDFGLETLGPAPAQELWALKGWGPEPAWLLLSPTGEEAAQGRGRPKGAEILDGIHGAGGKPRYELREAFLKEHPDQGEARLEAVNQAFQLLRMRLLALDREGRLRIPAWHQDPATRARFVSPRISLPEDAPAGLADDLFAEVAEALERLLELPGWEQEAGAVASHLAQWDLSPSLRLRKLFARASASLEASLRREPYDSGLANFWMEVADAAGLGLGNLAGLCLPVPGQPWPEADLVTRLLEPSYRRRDWDGALKVLADLTPQAPPEPMTVAGWESYRRLLGALHAQRAMALGGLGSWDLAGAALGEARAWGGSQGVRMALIQRGSLFTGPGPEPGPWRSILGQATQGRDPEPPEMPEPAAPLRLVVGGMPRWLVEWTALRKAPELAWWSPEELRWEVADRAAHEAQRQLHRWQPGPRWALYQGEDLLASGRTCPEPRSLAAALERSGPSLLQRLNALVAAQPDHLAGRWERYRLLERRMPDPRLEPLMAQDAARALVTLDFEPGAAWKPDPSLWGAAAQQALPALEESLRSWPSRAHLWRAWISWARFHPAEPSVLALAQRLPFWSPRGDWRAGLPYEVQRTVAAELRRQGDFATMREWFRGVWASLDQRPLRQLHRGEQHWVLERRREEETAVFRPLREALAALNCTQEQAELERVFGEMMGRAPSRRP